MSTISPAASTPPRRRDGPWAYPHDYESSPHYAYHGGTPGGTPRGHGVYYSGPPSASYGGPPPPQGVTSGSDYWGYDHGPPRGGAYWGAPPSYENYPPPLGDRSMPPPSRGPRGPIRTSLSHEESPPTPHMRIPNSPGSYHRGPPPLQARQGDFLPPRPRGPPSKEDNSGKDKKKGDPLSILANVSAGMTGKDGKKKQHEHSPLGSAEARPNLPMPAPTSPLQRRSRPSPITPNQSTPENKIRSQRPQVTPSFPPGTGARPPLEQPPSWDYGPDPGYMDPPPPPAYYPSRRRYPGYGDYPQGSPALVERGSFDSQSEGAYRDRPFGPPTPYHYDEHAYGYWEAGPPPYPPPRYNHYDWYDGAEDGYGNPYRPPPTAPVPPYTMVQQPRLEEKTILRKKFSWKHYPELERFLIANRDEYLQHSNMNYTAEQKQYNNWLTEQLLELAGQHNYVFDPEDFNFVAIRDRIRCYYKSYVQTARKRGLKLPEKKKE